MPISTFCPRPVFSRLSRASVMPWAAAMPATRSPIELPTFTDGRPAAGIVALAGFLDLDDLRAHVAQRHGAEGPGQHPGEIDDTHAGERRPAGRAAGRGLVARGGCGLAGAGPSLRHGASCSTCL